jgi:hypothetical protein
MFNCKLCSCTLNTSNEFLKHLRDAHFVSSFTNEFCCTFRACHSKFNDYKSFKKHIKNHEKRNDNVKNVAPLEIDLHVDVNVQFLHENSLEHQHFFNEEVREYDSDDETSTNEYIEMPPKKLKVNDDHSDVKFELSNKAATEISKLYAYPDVSRKIIQNFVDVTANISNSSEANEVHSQIITVLEKYNMSREDFSLISQNIEILKNPYQNHLRTDFKRMNFFSDKGSLIKVQDHHIGFINKKNRNGLEESSSAKTYVFDLVELFQKYLSLPLVLKTIIDFSERAKRNNQTLFSFLQGEIWKDKIKVFGNDIIIPLSLFVDDFEPNNPLGSKATIYKIGGVYLSIPALPLHLQCDLENIFVAALHFAEDRKVFGMKKIMLPVVEQLEKLQNGITVTVDNETKFVRFCLAYVQGDNLGLNELLGFTTSFNAKFNCRFCKADKIEWQNDCDENPLLLRNKNNYETDLLKGNISLTGINEDCFLHDSQLNFHATNNFIVDLMHDWLEGICKYNLGLVLHDLILKKKVFQLQQLNNKIQYFEYMQIDKKNIPPLITEDNLKKFHIKASAAEMLCLMRYLPLMVGEYVPISYDDDDNETIPKSWKFFMLSRKILFLLLAPEIQKSAISYIEFLISEHHEMYKNIFQQNLKPKYHLATHYGRIMRQSGPVVHQWCMRKEAKHKISKQYSRVNCNRIDMLQSVAWKHQMTLNNRFINNKGFENVPIKVSKGRKDISDVISNNFNLDSAMIYSYKMHEFVVVNGIDYRAGCCLIIDDDDDDENPKFFKVLHVLVDSENNVQFVGKMFVTQYFDEHYGSYRVELTSITRCLHVKDLSWKVPLKDFVIKSSVFITLREAL